MRPIPGPGGRVAPTSDADMFLALVCSDELLVRTEFDAIIAAEWPSPPPLTPTRSTTAGIPARRTPRHRITQAVAGTPGPRHPATSTGARQRSPPTADARHRPEDGTPREEVNATRHRRRADPSSHTNSAPNVVPATRPGPPPTNPATTMDTERPDPYAILGLHPGATQDQITHAYRTLLRQHHPDTRTPGDQTHHAMSDTTLQQILDAHTILGDPARRAEYDRQVSTRSPGASPPPQRTPTTRGTHDQPPIIAGPVHWHPGPDAR